MSNDIQQQTTVNIQEKANLIWAIADKLVGVYNLSPISKEDYLEGEE